MISATTTHFLPDTRHGLFWTTNLNDSSSQTNYDTNSFREYTDIFFTYPSFTVAGPGFPVWGRRSRKGGHWLRRRLRFENFVCRNKRIWTLRGRAQGTRPRSANALKRGVSDLKRRYWRNFGSAVWRVISKSLRLFIVCPFSVQWKIWQMQRHISIEVTMERGLLYEIKLRNCSDIIRYYYTNHWLYPNVSLFSQKHRILSNSVTKYSDQVVKIFV